VDVAIYIIQAIDYVPVPREGLTVSATAPPEPAPAGNEETALAAALPTGKSGKADVIGAAAT
jgi:hypothetical protein